MEQNLNDKPLSNMQIARYIESLRKEMNFDDEVYGLVKSDLEDGLTQEQTEKYLDRIGCFLISMAILFIPVYTYEPVMKNVPNAVILLIGVLAVVIIIVLAPVESINKPLDEEERKYYARVTHCITALQVCVLIILFCLDLQDYFYAGYVSIVLIAVFMVMGKIAVKRYVQ